jgi:putative Holliday junction resolvase
MQVGLCKIKSEFMRMVGLSDKPYILGLDLGGRKVGVAKGNIQLKIAVPLTVVEYKNLIDLATKLNRMIEENQVGGLVIGLPSGEQEERFIEYIKALDLRLPFIFEDETYTTKIANNMLSDLGMKRKKRHMVDDKISAQIILNAFFAN